MPNDTKFDLLIPLRLPSGVQFSGRSARAPIGFNAELAFTLFEWPASFHHTKDYRDTYFIVRTHCGEEAARPNVDRILAAFPFAAVMLDLGMRPVGTVVESNEGWDVNLDRIYIMPAGSMPRVNRGGAGPFTVLDGAFIAPIEVLTSAFQAANGVAAKTSRAAEVYSDIDFEASLTSKLVLLATVLELLADQGKRDDQALAMIDEWKLIAKDKGRSDLVTALGLMQDEPKSASIRGFVRAACQAAKLSEEKTRSVVDVVGKLYRKRSAVVHGAVEVTPVELRQYRQAVRFALTGQEGLGPLGGAIDQLSTL